MSSVLRRMGQPLLRSREGCKDIIYTQQRRRFASDEHGDKKVNFWEAPTNVSSWKEEQIVLGVLGAWGVGIFTALKVFGGKKEVPAPAQ